MKLPLPFLPLPIRNVAKLSIILFFVFNLANQAFGQDIIIRTDSVRLKVDILQLENHQIRFRLFGNTDSLLYIINTRDVLAVELADGSRRVFNQGKAIRPSYNYKKYTTNIPRNQLTLSASELLFLNLSVAYERISASGKVGVKFHYTHRIGLIEEDQSYYKTSKNFSIGGALNYYPFKPSRFNYFLGPQVEQVYFDYTTYRYDNLGNPSIESKEGNFLSFAVSNGVYYHLSGPLVAALDVGIGLRTWSNNNSSNASPDFYETVYYIPKVFIPMNLQLGFRF